MRKKFVPLLEISPKNELFQKEPWYYPGNINQRISVVTFSPLERNDEDSSYQNNEEEEEEGESEEEKEKEEEEEFDKKKLVSSSREKRDVQRKTGRNIVSIQYPHYLLFADLTRYHPDQKRITHEELRIISKNSRKEIWSHSFNPSDKDGHIQKKFCLITFQKRYTSYTQRIRGSTAPRNEQAKYSCFSLISIPFNFSDHLDRNSPSFPLLQKDKIQHINFEYLYQCKICWLDVSNFVSIHDDGMMFFFNIRELSHSSPQPQSTDKNQKRKNVIDLNHHVNDFFPVPSTTEKEEEEEEYGYIIEKQQQEEEEDQEEERTVYNFYGCMEIEITNILSQKIVGKKHQISSSYRKIESFSKSSDSKYLCLTTSDLLILIFENICKDEKSYDFKLHSIYSTIRTKSMVTCCEFCGDSDNNILVCGNDQDEVFIIDFLEDFKMNYKNTNIFTKLPPIHEGPITKIVSSSLHGRSYIEFYSCAEDTKNIVFWSLSIIEKQRTTQIKKEEEDRKVNRKIKINTILFLKKKEEEEGEEDEDNLIVVDHQIQSNLLPARLKEKRFRVMTKTATNNNKKKQQKPRYTTRIKFEEEVSVVRDFHVFLKKKKMLSPYEEGIVCEFLILIDGNQNTLIYQNCGDDDDDDRKNLLLSHNLWNGKIDLNGRLYKKVVVKKRQLKEGKKKKKITKKRKDPGDGKKENEDEKSLLSCFLCEDSK